MNWNEHGTKWSNIIQQSWSHLHDYLVINRKWQIFRISTNKHFCTLNSIYSSFFSTVLVIPLNKSYPNHRRLHFVGDITIPLLILTVNLILKYSKLFSNLVFVSKVHQVLVRKVFFVLNTFLSNAIKHPMIYSILTGFIVLRNLFVFTFI